MTSKLTTYQHFHKLDFHKLWRLKLLLHNLQQDKDKKSYLKISIALFVCKLTEIETIKLAFVSIVKQSH